MRTQQIHEQFDVIRTTIEEAAVSEMDDAGKAKMLPVVRAGLAIIEQLVVDIHKLAGGD
jgi:hypothetical protein